MKKSLILLASSVAFALDIGVVLPLSGSVAAYGNAALSGIKVANAMQPTLKNGEKINLNIVDTKGDKIESITATERILPKVNAIIGEMITANTIVVMNTAEAKKVPVIAPAATNDKLLKGKNYAARVCFNDSFQGEAMAKYLLAQGKKTTIIVKDQATDYSLGLSKAYKKEFTKGGGEIIKELIITSGDKDFNAIVAQIASLNPDVVYLPLYYQEAALFVRQAKIAGVKSIIASADGVADEQFVKLAKEYTNNHLYTDSFDANVPPTELSKKYLEEYSKAYNGAVVSNFAAMGADAYFVLVEAANRCQEVTSECINQEIKKTKDYEGVSGVISIDNTGETKRSLIIKEIVNEQAVYKDTIK